MKLNFNYRIFQNMDKNGYCIQQILKVIFRMLV